MRTIIISSLVNSGAAIVLAILASKIRDYEIYFWLAAAFCFVAALAPWAWRFIKPIWIKRHLRSQTAVEIQCFYHSWLRPTSENINHVIRLIMIAMHKHSDAAVRSQEGLIQREIVDNERAAFSRLSNALQGAERTSNADLQERLGGYYRNYQNNRTWIAEGMKLTGLRLSHDAIFREWRRLDVDFLRELRRLSGPPRYDLLRQLIKEVGWGEIVTRDIESSL
jgi:hypothetical protein